MYPLGVILVRMTKLSECARENAPIPLLYDNTVIIGWPNFQAATPPEC